MTEPATLNALAAEVEAGTGPDRELDARIAELALGACVYTAFSPWQMSSGGATRKVPKYTAKVDAALALLREVLPDSVYEISTAMPGIGPTVAIFDGPRSAEFVMACAPTLPRAIVAAVIRAVAGRG